METGSSPVFIFLFGEMMAKRDVIKAAKAVKRHPRPSDGDRGKRQRAFALEAARLIEPLCIAEGMELVHVEYQREPGGLCLRVYLDKPGGVTLDDCVDISRQLEAVLDVHAQDAPPYRLEVSSPGFDRPVGKLADYIRFEGQRIRIRVGKAVNGRKNFTGILSGVVDETIQLQVGKEMISLNFNDITRARLIDYNGER
jgi:ribosome maturation factor RimP